MNKCVAVALFAVLPLVASAQAAKPPSGWKSVPPSGNPQSLVVLNGAQRLSYYELSEEPMTFTAKGPGTLLVNTILEFPAGGTTTEQEYSLLVVVDGKKPPVKLAAKALPDKVLKFEKDADKLAPGEKKPLKIEIASGDHTFAVMADPACAKTVLARMYVVPKLAGSSRSTHIEAKPGHKSRYFALTAGETVRLTATGPMELRLFSKLDFPKDAKGPDSYGIFWSMDGGRAQRDSFSSDRSKTAKYADPMPAGSTPGKGRNKIYDVPAGKHVFVFSLDKTSKQTVWVRLYLRKK